MLFQEDERGDGMRTQTDEARHPATEGPSKALLARDIPQKTEDAMATALSRRGAHDAGLNDVHRTADGRGDKSGHEGGREMRAQVIMHAEFLDTQALEGVVGGQLRGGHQDGARRVRPHAAEETRGSLGATHLHQAVERMAVVSSLLRGQRGVGLHAHVQHVRRVSCNSAEEARCTGHSNQGEEAGRRVGGRDARLQLLVDAEPGGGIRDLSQEGCRQLQD